MGFQQIKKPLRGAPTKFKKKYCELVIKYLSEGNPLEAFGCTLTPPATRSTVYYWKDHYECFSDAIDIGRQSSLTYWMGEGRGGMHERDFKPAVWVFIMKNVHNWNDKTEIKEEKSEEYQPLESMRNDEPDDSKDD